MYKIAEDPGARRFPPQDLVSTYYIYISRFVKQDKIKSLSSGLQSAVGTALK